MYKAVLFVIGFMALAQCSVMRPTSRDGTRNNYIVYTPVDPVVGEVLETPLDPESLTGVLIENLPIIIIVHGHDGSSTTSLNPLLKNEILTYEDANVIVVDWSTFSNRGYTIAASAVPSIGFGLADFIRTLVAAEFTLNNIHLIGFDLGAHVCGFAGREVRQGRDAIAKITGLNPTGQYWGPNSGRLSREDAVTVEVIHSDNFQYGINEAIGDIDMFINRGRNQPGCATHLCSHNRAYEIMAASVSNTALRGNHCDSFIDAERGSCHGQSILVGTIGVRKLGSGIYRANTGRTYPF